MFEKEMMPEYQDDYHTWTAKINIPGDFTIRSAIKREKLSYEYQKNIHYCY